MIKVLIVDDESDFACSIAEQLESFNFDVLMASGTSEAIETLNSRSVDVILADIRMPEYDGIELIKNLNKMLKCVPKIIVMSGSIEFTQHELSQLGAVALLQKPFHIDELLKILGSSGYK